MSETYTHAVEATTAVAYTAGFACNKMPGGVAHALLVTETLSSGLTLTMGDATTIALGNQTIGTMIRIEHKIATFSAGKCVGLAK